MSAHGITGAGTRCDGLGAGRQRAQRAVADAGNVAKSAASDNNSGGGGRAGRHDYVPQQKESSGRCGVEPSESDEYRYC
jgi:hypothetical protein